MRWRLILGEFGPELKYIKGENKVVANDLSCLEISDNQEILTSLSSMATVNANPILRLATVDALAVFSPSLSYI